MFKVAFHFGQSAWDRVPFHFDIRVTGFRGLAYESRPGQLKPPLLIRSSSVRKGGFARRDLEFFDVETSALML